MASKDSKTSSSSKGSKVNRAWINDHVNDPYVKLATREGYRARAAYKLKELSVQLVRNEKPAYNAQYDNGFKKVNTLLLKPTPLTKANLELLVKDGFFTEAQIAGK